MMKNILYSKDLDQKDILSLFDKADAFLSGMSGFAGESSVASQSFSEDDLFVAGESSLVDEPVSDIFSVGKGKILANLFYEPSTRTRFSFESAMNRIGGDVVSDSDMLKNSSSRKGESLFDTGRVLSRIVDLIVIRHPDAGAAEALAEGADVPVINAGDGSGDHPTQGLLDLFTIRKEIGRLDNINIGIWGDLKNSRVAHSQVQLLSKFKGVNFTLISPRGLELPDSYKSEIENAGGFVEIESPDRVIGDLDVLSVTRVQKERFANEREYSKYKSSYFVDKKLMGKARDDMILIHPLPRLDEIDPAVDSDPRAKYFEQVENGVALRAALLANLLSGS